MSIEPIIGFNTLNFSQRWFGKFFRNEIPFFKNALPNITALKTDIAIAFVGVTSNISYNLYRVSYLDKLGHQLSDDTSYGNNKQYTGKITGTTGETRRFSFKGLKFAVDEGDLQDFINAWLALSANNQTFTTSYGVKGRLHV